MLVDKLFEYVRQFTGSMRKGYMIYGHSAGGQFVQRFMLFHDSPYVEKAIISSPGWYTFPDLAQTYPYGTAGIPYISSEQIKNTCQNLSYYSWLWEIRYVSLFYARLLKLNDKDETVWSVGVVSGFIFTSWLHPVVGNVIGAR